MRVLLAVLLAVWMVGSSNESEAAEPLTLRRHSEPVLSVRFSPDGKRIVSGSDDNTLKVWNISSLDTSK
jgi:WD40 repeat protein